MRTLTTQVDIQAPVALVWDILVDLQRYSAWNPFIPRATGTLEEGAKIDICIAPPGAAASDYQVEILRIVPEKQLRWLGHFRVPGLIDGDHLFELEALGPQMTRLVQRESFSGALVPFVWKSFINRFLLRGFVALNEALKRVAEERFRFPSVNSDVEGRSWDVIVVGTGMGGACLGYSLAKDGKSVLFVEKGRAHLRGEGALRGTYPELASGWGDGADRREILQRAGRASDEVEDLSTKHSRRFVPFVGCGTGGSSALFGMALERFHRKDFTPRACFPDEGIESNVPRRWPITYDELGPHYEEVERLFKVRGTTDPLRSEDAPSLISPPPFSPANQELVDFLQGKGLNPYHVPMACDYDAGDDRSQGFLDASASKRDAATVCLVPALRDHGAELLDQTEVLSLEASRTAVTGVVCLRRGQRVTLRGKQVVLAAGALATPALLLNSASSDWPQGLANDSGQVGRNLMRHHVDLYAVSTKTPVASSGPLKQLAFNDFYFAEGAKLGTVQSFGELPPAEVICAELEAHLPALAASIFGLVKPLFAALLGRLLAGKTVLATIMEDLPSQENRVSLSERRGRFGQRRAAISYRISEGDAERTRSFRRTMAQLLRPYRVMLIKAAEDNERLAHVCGTCRAGVDEKRSVVDANCKAHGLSNLYVADASFFPSSAGTNPGLTIGANALRVAQEIRRVLNSEEPLTGTENGHARRSAA